jgi:hypothetical protein
VQDPAKDFAESGEWFCWAAFERLMARKCCEVWLPSAAGQVDGAAREHILAASRHYGRAWEFYEQFRSEVQGGEPTPLGLRERARTPERIAVIGPLLEQGIIAEAEGLRALRKGVDRMD